MEAAADQQQQCQDFLIRSKGQRLGPAAFPYSPTGSLPGSPSAASKCLSFLLQQQQQQHDRAAAAASLMLGGSDEAHKFMARPRLDRADFASLMIYYYYNPTAGDALLDDLQLQEQLAFLNEGGGYPAHQLQGFDGVECRSPDPGDADGMFAFGLGKQQQGDFSGCTTPTGGLDARDPFDLHQLDARMLQHSNSANELLLRRKLEEEQQAAELQHAIELQSRRLMGLQLLDLKARAAATAAAASALPTPVANAFASSHPLSTMAVESPLESGEQLKQRCWTARAWSIHNTIRASVG
ncbi:hypothetical protein ACJX0J_041069, partial [Zea mays]